MEGSNRVKFYRDGKGMETYKFENGELFGEGALSMMNGKIRNFGFIQWFGGSSIISKSLEGMIEEIWCNYDTDRTGSLNFEETKRMIQHTMGNIGDDGF